MGPKGALRLDDGPACRVCGCTQNNACSSIERRPHPSNPGAAGGQALATTLTAVACHWVTIDDSPRSLCSACSGTADDMREAITRGLKLLKNPSVRAAEQAVTIGKGAIKRRDARVAMEEE
jgi:hypothetical protein